MLLIFSEMPHPCFPATILQILCGSRKRIRIGMLQATGRGWAVRNRILNLDFRVVPFWECQLHVKACLGTSFLINSVMYLFLPCVLLLDRK